MRSSKLALLLAGLVVICFVLWLTISLVTIPSEPVDIQFDPRLKTGPSFEEAINKMSANRGVNPRDQYEQ